MADLTQPEVKGDAGKVLRWINTLLICAGGFVAVAFWNDWRSQQHESKMALESLREGVNSLKTETAVFNASRFTSTDWTKAKENLDERHNQMDRRVGKLEDGMVSIKDEFSSVKSSLSAIKGGLGISNGGRE